MEIYVFHKNKLSICAQWISFHNVYKIRRVCFQVVILEQDTTVQTNHSWQNKSKHNHNGH